MRPDISNAPFEVFYDGACKLCSKEIRMLMRLDTKNRIVFTDISAPSFNSETETGHSYETLMASIHGRMPDGTLVEGVEVFRQLYGRVGLRGLMPLTQLPGVREVLDLAYDVFAKNRLRLTGRCEADGECRVEKAKT